LTHRLEIVDLTCTRGDRPLFEGLGQQAGAGELLHAVGSNGSGKTTLLRTLCGLSRPALGDIRWDGAPIRTLGEEYRQHVAYVGHLDGVQGDLTPLENLTAFGCLAGTKVALNREQLDDRAAARERVEGKRHGCSSGPEAALERMGLAAYRSFPAKILSQGQKRRLALARLLVVRKPLWILDEPFTALDVRSCRLMAELLSEHLAHGGIAVISSHQDFDLPSGAARKRIDLDDVRARGPYHPEQINGVRNAAVGRNPA